MKIAGPIVILEDDIDDQEILSEVFRDLGIHVELVFFIRPEDAFDFLKRTSKQPFLILSDVNLPGQSGIEFKRRIDDDQQLRQKSIPFVFYSTSVEKYAVDTAFKEMTVQGFFKKSSNYEDIKSDILLIMKYWYFCKHPNSVLG